MSNRLVDGKWTVHNDRKPSKEEIVIIEKMFADIKQTKRQMTNDEWNYLKLTQYPMTYFFISSEYFVNLKNNY